MPLMMWTPEMSVSVKVLDEDHKKLIDMINTLHEGIASGEPQAALEAVLEGLLRYTKFHFAREEKILAQAGFPQSAAHTSEHNLLSRRVMNLQSRFECGQSAEMSLEAMRFVKNWLTDHILGSDMTYGAFLNARGIV